MKNKTLNEKRKELFNNFDVPEYFQEIIKKQDKEFIEDILEEIDKSTEQDIKERGFPKNISIAYRNYFKSLIKQKAGEFK